jgi:hypothetical protein
MKPCATSRGEPQRIDDEVRLLDDRPGERECTSLKLRATFKCPFCLGIIPNAQLKPVGPVTCPICLRQLQQAGWQLYLLGLIPVGLTVVLCRLAGLRGLKLFAGTVILLFPVGIVWSLIFHRIVPPKFQAYVPRTGKKPTDSDSHSSGLDLFHR